jgi:hypothetical protein
MGSKHGIESSAGAGRRCRVPRNPAPTNSRIAVPFRHRLKSKREAGLRALLTGWLPLSSELLRLL